MANFEIVMPKLGESIIEATITRWMKQLGDVVAEDDPLVEIATDKVDSEIPSPVEGKIVQILFKEGDVVAVGKVIAIIDTADESSGADAAETPNVATKESSIPTTSTGVPNIATKEESIPVVTDKVHSVSDRFFSPLVKRIASEEGVSQAELQNIQGTGKDGRLTKNDILTYLSKRSASVAQTSFVQEPVAASTAVSSAAKTVVSGQDQIIEMDRMRRLIADHMVMSKQISPHVTSFIEVDMTKIVQWREKNKVLFEKREGEKLTFTPIIIEVAARTIKDFPGVNASVDGYNIVLKKKINIGMATMLPNGNLIVPVIRDADKMNLPGLAGTVNDLATRARNSQLQPDDIQNGTFTITNLGSFGSITGTPIINQPQVAILAIGAIRKMPAVMETPEGDVIAIRHKMILALTYDHRAVDGGLGGLYLKKMTEYLENFDVSRIA